MTDNNSKIIAVIEDDKFYRDVYKSKLTKEGFKVNLYENGKSGLEGIAKNTPDLIILDLVMPVMDGFEVLRRLKSDEKLKNLKVVVMSNLGHEEDIVMAKKLGVDDYVIKTNLSLEDAIETINKNL